MSSIEAKSFNKSIIYFDFETQQLPASGAKGLKHRVNLCVAEKVCDLCYEKEGVCAQCGPSLHVFPKKDDEDALDSFCRWLFVSGENKACIGMAHYMQVSGIINNYYYVLTTITKAIVTFFRKLHPTEYI